MTPPADPFETVHYEKRGPVAYVTLNRPHVINAYDLQMRDDLWEVLGAVALDPDVRALVLRGAGERGFCAGADLAQFGTAPSQAAARAARWERDVFGRLRDLPAPTVAALHGHVIGSGVELALLCDLRIAADDAVFSMPETRYGLIAAAGGTGSLPRAVRPGAALDMLLTGRRMDACQALRAGLVQRVVPRARLDADAAELAGSLAGLPPDAARAARRALRAAEGLPHAAGFAEEQRLAMMLASQGSGAGRRERS